MISVNISIVTAMSLSLLNFSAKMRKFMTISRQKKLISLPKLSKTTVPQNLTPRARLMASSFPLPIVTLASKWFSCAVSSLEKTASPKLPSKTFSIILFVDFLNATAKMIQKTCSMLTTSIATSSPKSVHFFAARRPSRTATAKSTKFLPVNTPSPKSLASKSRL